jgi:hypothetical protein
MKPTSLEATKQRMLTARISSFFEAIACNCPPMAKVMPAKYIGLPRQTHLPDSDSRRKMTDDDAVLACQLAEPPKPKQSNNVRDAPACLLSN